MNVKKMVSRHDENEKQGSRLRVLGAGNEVRGVPSKYLGLLTRPGQVIATRHTTKVVTCV